MGKTCFKCGEWKSFSEFYKHKKRLDGHQTWCKLCRKAHYKANKEQANEYQREHYSLNKDWIREHQKEYYEANKENILEQKKDYYQRKKSL